MFSKKLALFSLCLCVSSAHANLHQNRVYIGIDAQSNRLREENVFKNILSFKDSLGGRSIFAGYRWDNLAAEFGYTWFQDVNYNGQVTLFGNLTISSILVTQKSSNMYLDGIYFQPLTDKLDIKALLGIGYFQNKFDGRISINPNGTITGVPGKTKNAALGPRVGLGMEWAFSKNFSTGLMYKFQLGNKYFKNIRTIALNFTAHY